MASHVGDAVAEAPTDVGREQVHRPHRMTEAARDCAISQRNARLFLARRHHAITARGLARCSLLRACSVAERARRFEPLLAVSAPTLSREIYAC
jgi:hypothetical protein